MNRKQHGSAPPTAGTTPDQPAATSAFAPATRPLHPRPHAVAPRIREQRTGLAWLTAATAAVALLAVAAAVVSWDAQYVMVARARHTPQIAALEAGIPDAGTAVFAALGIALAAHGRRALRPRTLNLACVGLSLVMNAMAAGPGWRAAAIWVMPSAVYALASDSLIAVVRAHALARMRAAGDILVGDDATPLAVAGHAALWLLRLAVAPASTLAGFRHWLITTTPVAPGSPLPQPRPAEPLPPCQPVRHRSANGKPAKQDLLIAFAAQRHDLQTLPLRQVPVLSAAIAADIGLHPGTARRVLRAHVQALQAEAGRPAVNAE